MTRIEVYRRWYEQEKASNAAMLVMLASVPGPARSDPRFGRALTLAAHLAAARHNWLDRMIGEGENQQNWWPEGVTLDSLTSSYETLEDEWSGYLAGLSDDQLDADFEFWVSPEKGYRWNIEGQVMQLIGHSFYHRGQIALLVDQLGGESVDTDYLYWAYKQQPERWHEIARTS